MSQQATQPEPIKFMTNGRAMTESELIAAAPKVKRPPADTSQKFHKGFRVEGHPPGAMEEAEKSQRAALEQFQHAQRQGQAFGKQPKEWDEKHWRMTQKKRPVRAKPYEVPEAANLCADMAKKAGWLDVVVTEIKRG